MKDRELEPLKKKPFPLWFAVMVHVPAPTIVTCPFDAMVQTPEVPVNVVVPESLVSSGSTSVTVELLKGESPKVFEPGSGIVMF